LKKISLLGATGSIGTSTLDVIENNPEVFSLVSFSFYKNMDLARRIIQKFQPVFVACGDVEQAAELATEFPNTSFRAGVDGLVEAAIHPEVDVVLTAVTGSIGFRPTIEAIDHGKEICLANKETLVMAGQWVMQKAKEKQVSILPVDSEHSAIFQCLQGQDKAGLRKLIITASGGSFREKKREELANVTVKEALIHPNWSMGRKITIDSSTMVNKGLEVIEAHWLFDVDYDDIEVVLHKESIVHSMVTFEDGAMLAQLGPSDMREPILYALSYPKRMKMVGEKHFSLPEIGTLHFETLDEERFPMLALAFKVGKLGGSFPTVYNAANEIAANAFLEGRIHYLDIESYITKAVESHEEIEDLQLEDIVKIDEATRTLVSSWILEKERICKR
jgi:1-deoxy-D-xylulose-5-phosphate reductoisomerase